MIEEVLKGFIESNLGTAVSEQFEETYSSHDMFEDQNYSALEYIAEKIYNVLDVGLFSEEVESEILDYYNALKDYLK